MCIIPPIEFIKELVMKKIHMLGIFLIPLLLLQSCDKRLDGSTLNSYEKFCGGGVESIDYIELTTPTRHDKVICEDGTEATRKELL